MKSIMLLVSQLVAQDMPSTNDSADCAQGTLIATPAPLLSKDLTQEVIPTAIRTAAVEYSSQKGEYCDAFKGTPTPNELIHYPTPETSDSIGMDDSEQDIDEEYGLYSPSGSGSEDDWQAWAEYQNEHQD